MKKLLIPAVALCLVAAACGPKTQKAVLVPEANFQEQMDTIPVQLYTITNGQLLAQVTNYGARVVSLFVPDRDGKAANVLIGHDNLTDYKVARGERYLGAMAGPVAGPISNGSFTIGGTTYNTDKNAGSYTFNGGGLGLDKRPWYVKYQADSSIQMRLRLQDGEEGFPGLREIQVTYSVAESSFIVLVRAITSKPTPFSVAWQPWFNLHGEGEGTVEDLELAINAKGYMPLDGQAIPKDQIIPVDGTPMDFMDFHVIGDRIGVNHDQINQAGGYNAYMRVNAFVHRFPLLEACMLRDPVSGRKLTVMTNRPVLHVETGNSFDGTMVGTNGKSILRHGGILLSCEDYPDALNQSNFPDNVVDLEGYYASTAIYSFSIEEKADNQ